MVKPLDERELSTLPMIGGSLSLRFESLSDLLSQRRDFLGQMGLFVSTQIQPRPFSEFNLTLYLPDTTLLATMPARLVQIVPYGDQPGLMIQLLRYPPGFLDRLDTWLKHEQEKPAVSQSPPPPPRPTQLEEVGLNLDNSFSDFDFGPAAETDEFDQEYDEGSGADSNYNFSANDLAMPAPTDEAEEYGDASTSDILEDLDSLLNATDEQFPKQINRPFEESGDMPHEEMDDVPEEEPPPPPPDPDLNASPPPPAWQIFSPGTSRVAMLEQLRSMNPNERARLAKQANRTVRSILMRDNESSVVFFLLQNPQITRKEVIDISKLTTIDHNIVTVILANQLWASSEDLRYNLVRNPKTPLSIALKLVHNLDVRNLRELAKDWGMKSQIKQLALRLVVQRGGS